MSRIPAFDLSALCRACLKDSCGQEMLELAIDMAEQFQQCTEVLLSDTSAYQQICNSCWNKCEKWRDFRKKSQMSDQRIKKAEAKGTLSTTWDLSITCRICLHRDDTVETFELSKDFRELFEKCTSVSVTDENQQICASCWGQCEDWWEFRKMSQRNDQKVRKSINFGLQEMRIENLEIKTEPTWISISEPQYNEDEPMEGILSVTVPGGAECKIEMLQCPICEQDFANVQEYEDHFKIHHRVTEENGISLPNTGFSHCLFPSSESDTHRTPAYRMHQKRLPSHVRPEYGYKRPRSVQDNDIMCATDHQSNAVDTRIEAMDKKLDNLHQIVSDLNQSIIGMRDDFQTHFAMLADTRIKGIQKLNSNMTKMARDVSDLKDILVVVPSSFHHWPMESQQDMDCLVEKISNDSKFRTQLGVFFKAKEHRVDKTRTASFRELFDDKALLHYNKSGNNGKRSAAACRIFAILEDSWTDDQFTKDEFSKFLTVQFRNLHNRMNRLAKKSAVNAEPEIPIKKEI